MAKATPRLTVQILSPDQVLYAGSALSVTSFNDAGRFDVLPAHANFVSLIKKAVLVRPDAKKRHEFAIEQGVLHCREDNVRVFVGMGSRI